MKQNEQQTVSVANDYTEYPGARYRDDGPFSGDEFYEDILKPKFDTVWENAKETLLIDLDGTMGYPSSFISQIITRLISDYKDTKKIKEKLTIKSEEEPILVEIIHNMLDSEK